MPLGLSASVSNCPSPFSAFPDISSESTTFIKPHDPKKEEFSEGVEHKGVGYRIGSQGLKPTKYLSSKDESFQRLMLSSLYKHICIPVHLLISTLM